MLPVFLNGQHYFRVEADFSIKAKNPDSSFQLYMGKVFFDKVQKKICYKISFPEPEVWVITDTVIYSLKNDSIKSKKPAIGLIETSIFNLSLHGNLKNYGLENSTYTLAGTKMEDGLMISTWEPPEKFQKLMGKILLANKNRNLQGIVIFNKDERILSKQFFNEYANVEGIDFPMKIVQFNYPEGVEIFQVTTFKNLKIDEKGNDDTYNYPVPLD